MRFVEERKSHIEKIKGLGRVYKQTHHWAMVSMCTQKAISRAGGGVQITDQAGWGPMCAPATCGHECRTKKPAPCELSFGFFFFGCYGSIMAERFQAINGQLRRRFQAIKGRFSEHKWPAINGGETAVHGCYKRTSLLSFESILSRHLSHFSLLLESFFLSCFSSDFQFGDREKS